MVSKIAQFLGHHLNAHQIADIVRRTCFHAMKQDNSVNYSWWDELGLRLSSESQFMRKGAASIQLVSSSLYQKFVNLYAAMSVVKKLGLEVAVFWWTAAFFGISIFSLGSTKIRGFLLEILYFWKKVSDKKKFFQRAKIWGEQLNCLPFFSTHNATVCMKFTKWCYHDFIQWQ